MKRNLSMCVVLVLLSACTSNQATPAALTLTTLAKQVTNTPLPEPSTTVTSAQVESISITGCDTPTSVDITYIANEGFLISDGTSAALIDGIFTEGFGRYPTPSEDTLAQLKQAAPPFDLIDLLLVTHNHPDHMAAHDVLDHLRNNEHARLIASTQVDDLLRADTNYENVEAQVIDTTPEFGAPTETIVNGIAIKAVRLTHIDDPKKEIQVVGFVLTIGGMNILHVGDATSEGIEAYQSLTGIDIAILSCFWFDEEYETGGKDVIPLIDPKAMIMMHIPHDQYSYYKTVAKSLQADIPPTYIMEESMETLRFTCEP